MFLNLEMRARLALNLWSFLLGLQSIWDLGVCHLLSLDPAIFDHVGHRASSLSALANILPSFSFMLPILYSRQTLAFYFCLSLQVIPNLSYKLKGSSSQAGSVLGDGDHQERV